MHSPIRRVLVSGHLNLDEPLRGLSDNSDEFSACIRDASLTAFERTIETALEKSVDVLLLIGPLLSSSPSLRACSLLRDGLEALLEEGIDVVCAGVTQQEWQRLSQIDCLPEEVARLSQRGENVFRLEHSSDHDLPSISLGLLGPDQTVSRELAEADVSLGITELHLDSLPSGQNQVRSLSLVLSTASHRPHSSQIDGILTHSPGVTQPVSIEQGPTGEITLIEINSDGEILLESIATASVVYPRIELPVEQGESLNEILDRAEYELLETGSLPQFSAAQLWQITWEIRGLHQDLEFWTSENLIEQLQNRLASTEDGTPVLHRVVLAALPTGGELTIDQLSEETLVEHFIRSLGNHFSHGSTYDSEQRELQKSLGDTELSIEESLRSVNQEELRHRAIEFGIRMLNEAQNKAG